MQAGGAWGRSRQGHRRTGPQSSPHSPCRNTAAAEVMKMPQPFAQCRPLQIQPTILHQGKGNNTSEFKPFILFRFCVRVKIHEHDHEQEQYHDSAGVNDQIYDADKLGVQHYIMTRNSEENCYEPKYTMDGVFADHHCNCAEQCCRRSYWFFDSRWKYY